MSLLNDTEQEEFYISLSDILKDLILNINIKRYVDYSFDLTIKNEIYTNFEEFMDYDLYSKYYDKKIEEIYMKENLKKRSYLCFDSDKEIPTTTIQQQIHYLKNVPQPEQKTEEWYKFRKNHITGSNAWKIFGTESSRRALIYEKLQPDALCVLKSSLNETPLNWGHKYEPLSILFYEYFNDVRVDEFGCIPHCTIPYLAASPDGIVVSKNKLGRMVEIKNVVSREITKIPKMEYYIQMQLQMEVCNLDHCDFVETKFNEYDTFEEFKDDKYKIEKGMIIVLIKDNSSFVYEYSNLFQNSSQELDIFTENVYSKYGLNNDCLEHDNIKWFKNIYWKLDIFSCVYVPRNKIWFNHIEQSLNDFWAIIEEEQKEENAYLKYKPKSRSEKKTIHNTQNEIIDLNS